MICAAIPDRSAQILICSRLARLHVGLTPKCLPVHFQFNPILIRPVLVFNMLQVGLLACRAHTPSAFQFNPYSDSASVLVFDMLQVGLLACRAHTPSSIPIPILSVCLYLIRSRLGCVHVGPHQVPSNSIPIPIRPQCLCLICSGLVRLYVGPTLSAFQF